MTGYNLPPGCTDRHIDEAASGYWDDALAELEAERDEELYWDEEYIRETLGLSCHPFYNLDIERECLVTICDAIRESEEPR